ncbi:MAG: hypothetical protein ABR906_09460 [Terracidiphilus sp.]|jgi:hypothetical protein
MSPEKLPTDKSAIKWVASIVLLILVCCFGVPWWINFLLISRLDRPSFSTDQMLASLGVMITGLGLFIALAAVGIAVFAVLGFSELRSMVDRRIDAGLDLLRKKGSTGLMNNRDVDMAYLTEDIEQTPENSTLSARIPQQGITEEGNPPETGNVVGTSAEQPIAREYPQGKESERQ